MIFRLAYRNIRTNIRRSIITVLAIAVGLMVLMLSGTLRTGQYDQMINSSVSQLAGHVVVQQKGFQEEREAELLLEGHSVLRSQLKERFPQATITTRSFLGGLLTSTSGPSFVALTAIDPTPELEITEFKDNIVDGEWLDDNLKGILIGKNMAETLNAELGDKLVFTTSIDGEMSAQLFRVRGIFRTGVEEVDSFTGYIHYKAAEKLFDKKDVAHQLALHFPLVEQSAQATLDTKALIASDKLEILSWQEALPEIVAMVDMDQVSNEVINMILFFIVAMGILNTMLMSVLERTQQFGVMLAIGMKANELIKLILAEAFVLGILGSLLGLVLGLAVSYPLVEYGLDLSASMGDGYSVAGAVTSTIMYGKYNWGLYVVYVSIALVFTVLSAIYPAWKLRKLKAIDAMRHN